VGLVGRVVDLAANLIELKVQPSENARTRMRRLTEIIAGIRADLLSGRVPHPIEFPGASEASHTVPLLSEMERNRCAAPRNFYRFSLAERRRATSLGRPGAVWSSASSRDYSVRASRSSSPQPSPQGKGALFDRV